MIENKPEDSMEEIIIESEEDTLAPYESGFDQVDMMLSQAINISNEGSLHEPTCAICNSSLRNEVEELWDKSRITTPITKLLREKTNVVIGADIIRNHMKNHKDCGVQEMKKVEFVDRVRRLYQNNATTLEGIKLSMAIIIDQVMQISSMIPSGDKSSAEIKNTASLILPDGTALPVICINLPSFSLIIAPEETEIIAPPPSSKVL